MTITKVCTNKAPLIWPIHLFLLRIFTFTKKMGVSPIRCTVLYHNHCIVILFTIRKRQQHSCMWFTNVIPHHSYTFVIQIQKKKINKCLFFFHRLAHSLPSFGTQSLTLSWSSLACEDSMTCINRVLKKGKTVGLFIFYSIKRVF